MTCFGYPEDGQLACYVKQMRMPTRALGDLVLKHAEFNFHSYMPGMGYEDPIPKENYTGPYLNYLPDIRVHTLTKDDRFLVLASDGLWDEMNRKESAQILTSKLQDKQERQTREICKILREACLGKAAENSGRSRSYLDSLPKGIQRRRVVDDITIVATDLQGQYRQE